MSKEGRSRPLTVWLLETTVLIQGISGVAGGLGFMLDPSGESLQIPLEWLDGSPFSSYLIPGVLLFLVLGVFPLVTLIGIRRGTARAWIASIAVGIGLLIWIGVEILVIGYQPSPPLQLIYGILGVLILVLAALPATRTCLRSDAEADGLLDDAVPPREVGT